MNEKIDFLAKAKSYEKEALESLRGLLRIPSVYDEKTVSEKTPFGQAIEDALCYMLDLARKDGFKTEKDGGYAGHIEYGEGDEVIGVLCHLDVVPTGAGWTNPPFDPVIKDRKVYARGSMDDKGPTMAAYYALKMLKDLRVPLKKKVRIILGTDEETAWRGIEHYGKTFGMPEIGFAPDSDFPLIYGEKGILHLEIGREFVDDELISFQGGERYNIVIDHACSKTKSDFTKQFEEYLNLHSLRGSAAKDSINGVPCYVYTVEGQAAHAMEPDKGINAGVHLANFLSAHITNPLVNFVADYFFNDVFLKKMGLDFIEPEMGPITCNVGIIDIGSSRGRVCFDFRYPINYDKDKFWAKWRRELQYYNLNITSLSDKVPHYVDRNSKLVQTLYQAYVKYTNDTVNQPKTIGGGTYARALKQGVAFGMEMPYEVSQAHQKDEAMSIDTFLLAMAIYAEALMQLGTE